MKRSISLKLLSLFSIALFSVVFFSFLLHAMFFQNYYVQQREAKFLELYEIVETYQESTHLQQRLSDLDRLEQIGIAVAEPRLRTAVYSHIPTGEDGVPLERELHELIQNEYDVLKAGAYVCKFILGDEGPDRLVFVKRFESGDYCIMTHSTGALESSFDTMYQFHMIAGGLATLVSVFLVLLFSRKFTRPIIAMSEVTEGLSQLDFQQKVAVSSEDELGQLGRSINVLSERLEENREALKREIDFQKVLSQNMSHELKTPIAVIKGYLEALSFGIVSTEEEQEEYFQVIIQECDRMTQVIDVMLHLSKLTSFQENGFEKQHFSARGFQERVLGQSGNLLAQNQIQCGSYCDDMEVYGNEELLIQAYGNFVTNAVKYGDHQEMVSHFYEKGDMQVFSLYNSGVPLAQEECEKVFDVFYMVDKVRSRAANSHGLGLSVTKTIVELHGGSVVCVPREEGVSFEMRIPKVDVSE